MIGVVTPHGVPTIAWRLEGRDWAAVIDTGFNGQLELPEALQDGLALRYRGETFALLAGGVGIWQDAYVVQVPFDGQNLEAEATFVPGETILIGTGMLADYRLTVDFPDGTVELKRRRQS